MPVLYCSAFDITYNGEVFCLKFKFKDGQDGETVCIVIGDQGAKSLHKALGENIEKILSKDVPLWDDLKPQKVTDHRYIS